MEINKCRSRAIKLLAIISMLLLFVGCSTANNFEKQDQSSFTIIGEVEYKFVVEGKHFVVLVPENLDHMSAITIYIGTPAIYDSLIEQKDYEFDIIVDLNQEANRFEVLYEAFKELPTK